MSHHKNHCKDKKDDDQDEYYIDPCGGSSKDCRSGKSSKKKTFKSWADFYKKVCQWKTLNPGCKKKFTVTIQGDLDLCDAIVWDNYLAPDVQVEIVGCKEVVAEGTLTTVTTFDRLENIPNQVTVTLGDAAFWTQHIGRFLFVETTPCEYDNAAVIARDLGNVTAHLGAWSGPPAVDGICPPVAAPAANVKYQITDFPSVYLHHALVGSISTAAANEGAVTGLIFKHLRIKGLDIVKTGMPQAIGQDETVTAFAQCIVESPLGIASSQFAVLSNCSLLSPVSLYNNAKLYTTQSVFFGSSALGLEVAGLWLGGGDPTFVGSDAAVVGGGVAKLGPISFWDSENALHTQQGGNISLEPRDPIFDETGHVPIWGDGNTGAIVLAPHSVFTILQLGFGGIAPPGPSIQMGSLTAVWRWVPDGIIDNEQSHSFDPAAAAYTPLADNSWANLDVAIPAGFQVGTQSIPGDADYAYSVATTPQNGARLIKNVVIIP